MPGRYKSREEVEAMHALFGLAWRVVLGVLVYLGTYQTDISWINGVSTLFAILWFAAETGSIIGRGHMLGEGHAYDRASSYDARWQRARDFEIINNFIRDEEEHRRKGE